MKEFTQFILAIFIGFSVMTLAVSYYENAKSAQKIENIEKLYQLKTSLETQQMIEETEKLIDSINKIK